MKFLTHRWRSINVPSRNHWELGTVELASSVVIVRRYPGYVELMGMVDGWRWREGELQARVPRGLTGLSAHYCASGTLNVRRLTELHVL